MAVHVIIPARYGSSRFPGKPLVDIGGKPMIQRVMERAARAQGVQTVAAATDDQRIADAVAAFGGKALMTSSELRSGTDRVAAAADMLGLGPDEIVANVQGDQPLLAPEVISQTARPLYEDPKLGISTPVKAMTDPAEIADSSNVKTVMTRAGDALYFSRKAIPHPRDGGEVVYYKHLGVYLFRKWFLDVFAGWEVSRLESIEKLEQLRVLENGSRLACVITEYDSPEVDRPDQAQAVAAMLGD